MNFKRDLFFIILIFIQYGVAISSEPTAPTGLMTELLSQPERTCINDSRPEFSWVMNDIDANEIQSAYQILVDTSLSDNTTNKARVWNSGKVISQQSTAVSFDGNPLISGQAYFWKVKTWDLDGNESPYSSSQKFIFHEENPFELTNANISEGKLNLSKNAYVISGKGSLWKDYSFECEAEIVEEALGAIFRMQNSDNYYMWQLSAKKQKLRLHKKKNGKFYVLHELNYSLKTNKVYHIKIVVTASTMKIFIDGILSDSFTDDESPFTVGSFGFRMGSFESGRVDNILIKSSSMPLQYENFNEVISEYNYYSVESILIAPEKIIDKGNGLYFVDFGKAAFGRLKLRLTANGGERLILKIGESKKGFCVNATPPNANVVYYETSVDLKEGTHSYAIEIKNPDKTFTDPLFNTMPFRYCELCGVPGAFTKENIKQEAVFYPDDKSVTGFTSSDEILNKVWDLCNYSVKATTWLGIYVDGNRERKPYEADAYIQQLGHYCTDKEAYSIARRSHEYLMKHSTWPSEWTSHSVLCAYADWMWTGDAESIYKYYEDLKIKTQFTLTERNDLISTKTNLLSNDYLSSIHYSGSATYQDIVDWPAGERDNYVFENYNAVVNAIHYGAMTRFEKMSAYQNNKSDSVMFSKLIDSHKIAFNEGFWDKSKGCYKDGLETNHSALHASAFSVAFGLADSAKKINVADFLKSKEMDCSVYASQYFLEALYDVDKGQKALDLMRSTGHRSWYNMIREGSTISMESWGQDYKDNQDWSHAWGAVPANIIPRYLMGVRPLEPGFDKIMIKPQTANLKYASLKMPTIKGIVEMITNLTKSEYRIEVNLPANTRSKVFVPTFHFDSDTVLIDGVSRKGLREGNYIVFDSIGSGEHVFIREQSFQSDSDVPDAPCILTATPYTKHIDLSWIASADYKDNSLREYIVYRSIAGEEIIFVPIANVFGTVYSDADVQPGTAYCYVVTAVGYIWKESAFSEIAFASLPFDKNAPEIPTEVVAAKCNEGNSVQILWRQVPNADADLSVYKIYKAASVEALNFQNQAVGIIDASNTIQDGTCLTWFDYETVGDENNYYKVVSIDEVGNESDGTPVKAQSQIYLVEEAVGSNLYGDHSHWLGEAGYANFSENLYSESTWTVNISEAGYYKLYLRYSLLSGNRGVNIQVNDAAVKQIIPVVTGCWDVWKETMSVSVKLKDGENSIRLFNGFRKSINVNYIRIGENVPVYTLSFNAGGANGTAPESMDLAEDEEMRLFAPEALVKEDYVFDGWDDGISVYHEGDIYIMPDKSVTLRAVWMPLSEIYIHEKERISICPNPSKGEIKIMGLTSKAKMKIFNITGRLVFEAEAVNKQSIFIPLEAGTYTVKIRCRNGLINIQKLILIQ